MNKNKKGEIEEVELLKKIQEDSRNRKSALLKILENTKSNEKNK